MLQMYWLAKRLSLNLGQETKLNNAKVLNTNL